MAHTSFVRCALGVLVTAGLAAGCSSGTPAPAPSASTPVQQTITAAPPASQPAGAIKELSDVSCKRSGEAWSFSATLTNRGSARTAYTVLVAVARTQGGTVVGSRTLKKTLAPGDTATLEAPDFVRTSLSPKDVQCVPSATKAAAS